MMHKANTDEEAPTEDKITESPAPIVPRRCAALYSNSTGPVRAYVQVNNGISLGLDKRED